MDSLNETFREAYREAKGKNGAMSQRPADEQDDGALSEDERARLKAARADLGLPEQDDDEDADLANDDGLLDDDDEHLDEQAGQTIMTRCPECQQACEVRAPAGHRFAPAKGDGSRDVSGDGSRDDELDYTCGTCGAQPRVRLKRYRVVKDSVGATEAAATFRRAYRESMEPPTSDDPISCFREVYCEEVVRQNYE